MQSVKQQSLKFVLIFIIAVVAIGMLPVVIFGGLCALAGHFFSRGKAQQEYEVAYDSSSTY